MRLVKGIGATCIVALLAGCAASREKVAQSPMAEAGAGDVIVTGTPGGVGAKRVPPLWMKPGDTVEVEISGIGRLVNRVEDDRGVALRCA